MIMLKELFSRWVGGEAILLLLLFFIFSSCSSDDDSSTRTTTHTYKVAVLMHKSEQARWERTAQWAQQNIAEAQRGMTDKVQLELTFKDQDDEDIAEYMQQIAEDSSVVAVIGPTTSARAEQMAVALGKRKTYNKPMITPSATYVQYQRKFANVPYVWNLAESDITELEVVISEIASLHTSDEVTVELLAQDDKANGNIQNDYVEWFSFIAEEYGLKVSAVHLYENTADIRNSVREVCGPEVEKSRRILFFSPSIEDDALAFDRELGLYQKELEAQKMFCFKPFKIYCSDGFVSNLIASSVEHMEYEGVDLYASPESGFIQAYRQRFSDIIVNGEAQFYDALCLIAYAAKLQLANSEGLSPSTFNFQLSTLNDALLAVVDGRDGQGGSWLPDDMALNFQLLAQGQTPDIDGVSSDWNFDKKTHSCVVSSTYRRWRIFDQKYVTTEYVSTEGSRRSSSAKTMWDWTASHFQTFSAEEGSGLTYPTLDDRWALLIAASKGWANYRFQSDVFAMYQILNQHGYRDDHIVLICEDDVARHASNPYQGVLRISDTGSNVYDAAAIDYRLNTLTPNDIGDILQGRASERLPKVLSPDADDNVFIFWSSHGSPGSMDFGHEYSMSYDLMRDILTNTPHRKLLFAIEACYSGGLGVACEGVPGALFITAANPYETSHADVWSDDVGVYLSNGFTRGFQEAIDESPAITLRDLYYSLARHTTGSHVKVYNDINYGSVYNNTMAEFLH
jgi:hypothetical protein